MSKVITIGLDIAKSSFHAHGADERGEAVFSRKLTRGKLLDFFAGQPACLVAMEACGGAHHWARELMQLGHEVRLIPPAYVKPFVKRHKNDAVDAETICEAVRRPGMRFVAVKTEEQQAAGMIFRTRDLLVRQRTQLINALRGHLAEYGWVAPRGKAQVAMLADLLDEDEMASSLPEGARAMFRIMTDTLAELDQRIADLDKEIARRAREDEVAHRLRRSRVSGRSLPPRSWRWRLTPPRSARAATLLPGWVWPRFNTRRVASRSSAGSRKWANGQSGDCSSSAEAPWCGRQQYMARRQAHGWKGCWRASRECWSRWR